MPKKMSVGVKAALIGVAGLIIVAFIDKTVPSDKRGPSYVQNQIVSGNGNDTAGGNLSKVINNVQHPEDSYIEGTPFTYKSIDVSFPYGYIIFSYNPDRTFTCEYRNTGKMEWTIDTRHVQFLPDFNAGIVEYIIPSISASKPDHTSGFTITAVTNNPMGFVLPLQPGAASIFFATTPPNEPCAYICVLGTDQRKPVFCIGFRIPSKEEFNSMSWRVEPYKIPFKLPDGTLLKKD